MPLRPDEFLKQLFAGLHASIIEGYAHVPHGYTYIQGQAAFCYKKTTDPKWGYVLKSGEVDVPMDYGCTASVVVLYLDNGGT